MQITLDHTTPENYNIRTFWFRPESQVRYVAGQFIELYLPHDEPDSRGIKRWFTLSSSPTEDLISITTKYAGDKASSFKKALFNLKTGSKVKMIEPMGDFVLPKSTDIPLVFVAGGIGVTPFKSMVSWLTSTHEKRNIQVLLAANQPKDFVFTDIFENYGAKVTNIVTNPDSNWKGEIGTLTADKILELTGRADHKRIYVSGPEPMVETLETELHNHGIEKAQLMLDFFPGYLPTLK